MVHKISPQITTVPSPAPAQKEDGFAKLVGHFGLWQLLIFSSVFLVKLSSGWVQMTILFLTPNVKFWCGDANSTEATQGVCRDDCLEYSFDNSPLETTIVSEWSLVCARAWLASFTQTVLQLGILIGSILFGFLSDRYGRKNTFLLSVVTLIIFGFGVPFSPNYIVFTALRFCVGAATAGTMVVSFVLVVEAVGPKYRELFGCLFQIPFVLGHMTVPLFAFYFRRWDTYSLALAVPQLIYLGYFFVLTESPRWLVSVGRVDEAAVIVTNAARMNKLPTANVKEALTKLSVEAAAAAPAATTRPHYGALLRPGLRAPTAVCGAAWLAAGLTFFGFNQYISHTSPDPFVSVAAAAAIQIPANLASILLIRRFGRKRTTVAAFWLCGACVAALGLAPAHPFAVALALGTLGVSFACVVCNCLYIYTTELYPTVVRNMAMGACSTSMRVGSMAAPFVAHLGAAAATAVFAAAPAAAGLLLLLLPDTRGGALPDTMGDLTLDSSTSGHPDRPDKS